MDFKIPGLDSRAGRGILIALAALALIAAGVYGYTAVKGNKDIIIETGHSYDPQPGHQAPILQDRGEGLPQAGVGSSLEEIKVYVVGCVKNPGIVTIKKGQIISDAIEAAGGATVDADIENINLVYELNGNVMLRVFSVSENRVLDYGEEAGEGIGIIRDSGGIVAERKAEGQGAKININTAGINDLDTLPGIGEATAKDIIDYREKNGPFNVIEDIMKVPRIKENRFNSIKDFISVE